ncbi:MAG: hypothetical protein COA57_10680 [Flavobacteriales bacterium]|nr:MAG: hypothetical protein COA57_10680 [Flavobacteriales bacterium]
MSYFTKDFVQFFKELAANNNRDWFQDNKKRYEESVKKSFAVFVGDLIKEINKDDKTINPLVKDCVFRINRDVRFSKDKSPYKLHTSAVITRGGKKDKTTPGLYLQMGPEDVRIYGGIHMPDKDELMSIREYIVTNGKEFEKILNNKAFKGTYGELQGEKNKRLPNKDLETAAEKQPYIYNKDFYYFTKLKPAAIANKDLMETIMGAWKDGKPMKEFLTKAIGK